MSERERTRREEADRTEGRALPQSLEGERMVLGGCMVAPSLVHQVRELVDPRDFYRSAHGLLWRLMLEMADNGQPVEMIAVVEEVVRRGDGFAEQVGSLAYVSALPDAVPSTENIAYYATLVRDRALRRRIIIGAQEIAEHVYTSADPLPDVLGIVHRKVQGWDTGLMQSWTALGELIPGAVDRLADIVHDRAAGNESAGLRTGLKNLDRALNGVEPGKVVVVAARPGMGKTSLALAFADHIAATQGAVGIFSLEMQKEELATRLICSRARVSYVQAKRGRLRRADWARLHESGEVQAKLPIYIDDQRKLSAAQMGARLRRLKAERPDLCMVVVDYLQLMGGNPRQDERERITENSGDLKGLAKELGIVIVLLSQLNRDLEKRDDKRPILADLRGSGAIEQDADIILFIYRDEYYNTESSERGVAEILAAKMRAGATARERVGFEGDTVRFYDLED